MNLVFGGSFSGGLKQLNNGVVEPSILHEGTAPSYATTDEFVAVDSNGTLYSSDNNNAGTKRILRWSTGLSIWETIGTVTSSSPLAIKHIYAVGTDIYVGGTFSAVSGVPAKNIAKWDGTSWSALGSGIGTADSSVTSMTYAGSYLYICGNFTTAGSVSANNVARWSGSAWSAVGSGAIAGAGGIGCEKIVSYGTDIYLAGQFSSVGGVTANRIAKWDGSAWSAVGNGPNGAITQLLVVSDSEIYAAGPSITGKVSRWSPLTNGSSWVNGVFSLTTDVSAMAKFGSDIYFGIYAAGGKYLKLKIGTQTYLVDAPYNPNGRLSHLLTDGENLYAAGQMTAVGSTLTGKVAKWAGSSWSGFDPSDITGSIHEVVRDGDNVYIGGEFLLKGTMRNFAKWDGSAWSDLGSAIYSSDNIVEAIAVDGSNVYIGGALSRVGGVQGSLFKWNGSAWSDVGNSQGEYFSNINDLVATDGKLYVATGPDNIRCWDGSSWSLVGGGIGGSALAIAVNGNEVYVGGQFDNVGGTPSSPIAGATIAQNSVGITTGGFLNIGYGSDPYENGNQNFITSGSGPNALMANSVKMYWVYSVGMDNNSTPLSAKLNVSLCVGMVQIATKEVIISGTFDGWKEVTFTEPAFLQPNNPYRIMVEVAEVGAAASTSGTPSFEWKCASGSVAGDVGGTALPSGLTFIVYSDASGVARYSGIAKWNGTTWDTLDNGLTWDGWDLSQTAFISDIQIVVPDVYVLGSFNCAGNSPTALEGTARWDGTAWHAIGSGSPGYTPTTNQLALYAVSSNEVYTGGNTSLLKYDGSSWSTVVNYGEIRTFSGEVLPTFTVTYDGNTNSGGTAPVDSSSPYSTGSNVTISGVGTLVKTGYTFSGWNTSSNGSGTAYAASATLSNIQANVTLYAQWVVNAPTTFTVAYNGNTNSGGTAPVDGSSPYNAGSNVTILGVGTLVKSGYTFSGWNTSSNGSGTAYAASATLSNIQANVILYAQWVAFPTNVDGVVTIPATGGTITLTQDMTVASGGELTLDVADLDSITGGTIHIKAGGKLTLAGKQITVMANTLYALKS